MFSHYSLFGSNDQDELPPSNHSVVPLAQFRSLLHFATSSVNHPNLLLNLQSLLLFTRLAKSDYDWREWPYLLGLQQGLLLGVHGAKA